MENSEIKELLLDLKKGQEELFKGQKRIIRRTRRNKSINKRLTKRPRRTI